MEISLTARMLELSTQREEVAFDVHIYICIYIYIYVYCMLYIYVYIKHRYIICINI